MNAPARVVPQRRGSCPGLSAPMSTGDGLLVRFMPAGTVSLRSFTDLCVLARKYGNGVMEITSRGSIQVRGLSAAGAPRFAAEVATLGIDASDGVPTLTNALAGLDASERFDARSLAAELRSALAQQALGARLGAKVSIAIDGGGSLHLGSVAADVRLSAQTRRDNKGIAVAAGGDEATAAPLGFVAFADAVPAAVRLLDVIAARGREARARDIVAAEGPDVFRAALGRLLIAPPSPSRARERTIDTIGTHTLRDGTAACGVALPFGHSESQTLEELAAAAAKAGASAMRPASPRALFAIGLSAVAVSTFTAAADRLGFIVHPSDPRRHVVACAGAPICASAYIASRAMAPLVADIAAPHLGDAFSIHLSGCAKGCARSAPAALTIIGTPEGCALVARGTPRDTPFAVVSTDELPAAIANFARKQKCGGDHA